MKTEIKDTPFDLIAIRLSEAGRALLGKADKKLLHSQTFVQMCRVKYIQMYEVSERSWYSHEEMRKQPNGTRLMSTKDVIDNSLQILEVKINYFGFLEEINRFGRVFEKEYGVVLPGYFRIKFYRNKMIEHWDQYEEYLNPMGNGYMFQQNRIVVPAHFGTVNIPPQSEITYNELKKEFKDLGVGDLPPLGLEMTIDDTYSQTIFRNLEKIDPRLESIPKSLVNALFKYKFPVPVSIVEIYITELVIWLDNFTREYEST